MKYTQYMMLLYCLLFCTAPGAHAGVLVTDKDIIRGRKNIEEALLSAPDDSTSCAALAVRYILNREHVLGDSLKTSVREMLVTAHNNLVVARGVFSDSSSRNLYDAMMLFDLLERSNLWDTGERETLRKSMKFILDYYLRPEVMQWDDEIRSLGAAPMRITALCALFALNFQNDPDFSRYIEHSRQQLDRNLLNAVDNYGAWITDSPERAACALEYIIVTAKALKNGKVHDYFSNSRVRDALTSDLQLLTPRLKTGNRGVFTVDENGQDGSLLARVGISVMAADDIMAYSPSTASQLVWCWEECGRPTTSLGLLFIDTSIPSAVPEGGTAIVGDGKVVMRNNLGQSEESSVFIDFGGKNGFTGYKGDYLSYNGDFSFIWQGTPIMVHNNRGRTKGADYYRYNAAWRHNLVTKRGSGETPIYQENVNQTIPVGQTTNNNLKLPADFYPEGINQFFSTVMVDYTCGEVRLAPHDMSPSSYFRHVLFLKPDALLVWDQIQSAFPLEWNIWLPVESVGAENNILHLLTADGGELEAHFTNDKTVQYSIDKEISAVSGDWPLIMRAQSGQGNITVSFLDLINSARKDSSTHGLDILSDIVSGGNKQPRIGFIGGTQETTGILIKRGIACELLDSESIREENLAGYSTLIIYANPSMAFLSALSENSAAIDRLIKNGGSLVWICPALSSWFYDSDRGPAFIPASMIPGGCPITLHSAGNAFGAHVKISGDSLWNEPRKITRESLGRYLAGYAGSSPDSTGTTLDLPSSWSDSWKILVSLRATVPVLSDSLSTRDRLSRIRVYHPLSEDFFTLLLPSKMDKPSLFTVKNHGPGFISFTDDKNLWEIQTGGSSWTDANLSVRISNTDGIKSVYAFDCTNVTVGDERFRSEKPLSIYYSPLEDAGSVMTIHNTVLSTSRVDFKIRAGEINFSDFRGDVWTERKCYCTRLTAVDDSGSPAAGIQIFGDGRFLGATDDAGAIVLRWLKEQPEVIAKFRKFESRFTLAPGEMTIKVVK